MTGDKPPLAMTMGDPAGIGPELALAAWRDRTPGAPFVVFAPPGFWPRPPSARAWRFRSSRPIPLAPEPRLRPDCRWSR